MEFVGAPRNPEEPQGTLRNPEETYAIPKIQKVPKHIYLQGDHYVLVRFFVTLWGPWGIDFINFFNEQQILCVLSLCSAKKIVSSLHTASVICRNIIIVNSSERPF